jgi:hypothetical protein
MTKELLASRRQRRSAFIAHEKLPRQLLLKIANPCAYGRLADIQLL